MILSGMWGREDNAPAQDLNAAVAVESPGQGKLSLMERESSRPDGRAAPRSEGIDSPDGVDVTLIRWMLSLTPEERLRVLQERENALEEIRLVREGEPRWNSRPS